MKYYLGFIMMIVIMLISACKQKEKPLLSGDEPVAPEDFFASFGKATLPYQVEDNVWNEKDNDSLRISYKVFTQFVPDSVLEKFYGKKAKPNIYPLKKIIEEGKETYLIVKTSSDERKIAFILCFDKKLNFVVAMTLLQLDKNTNTSQVSGMDRGYSVFKNVTVKFNDGSVKEGKDAYAFNAESKEFMLIMTDPIDDRIKEVINPIDSFPRLSKYAGDYIRDKMNIVSIRDGKKPGTINFFIHFDKQSGECTGELKGMATLISNKMAEYKQTGDACVILFTFSTSSVSLKETKPCGTHRGVKCSFDASYPKKKITSKKK